jgi:hypothetical protein
MLTNSPIYNCMPNWHSQFHTPGFFLDFYLQKGNAESRTWHTWKWLCARNGIVAEWKFMSTLFQLTRCKPRIISSVPEMEEKNVHSQLNKIQSRQKAGLTMANEVKYITFNSFMIRDANWAPGYNLCNGFLLRSFWLKLRFCALYCRTECFADNVSVAV